VPELVALEHPTAAAAGGDAKAEASNTAAAAAAAAAPADQRGSESDVGHAAAKDAVPSRVRRKRALSKSSMSGAQLLHYIYKYRNGMYIEMYI
jgi:hypothetical protein